MIARELFLLARDVVCWSITAGIERAVGTSVADAISSCPLLSDLERAA